jgi:serine/threonine protein kinase
MNDDFHTHARRILDAAMQHPTVERDAMIELAARGDVALLREVRSLLPHYVQMEGFVAGLKNENRADEWELPFAISPYRVTEILGSGGMGIVYRGVQRSQDCEVAIKLLRPCLLAPEHQRRFQQEVELIRSLRHAGIVRFHYNGVAHRIRQGPHGCVQDDRPYFVMEYVRGRTLLRFADDHQLNALRRIDLLVKICDAAEYAHLHAVVHRDLKPDNILVDQKGQPKILDFGIATLQEFGGRQLADLSPAAGTRAYASPEQRNGATRPVSPASDVYSIGLIAHELLTGRLPGKRQGRLAVNLENVYLSRRSASSPEIGWNRVFRYALGEILTTALRCRRGQQYDTAGGLGKDLAELYRVCTRLEMSSRAVERLRAFWRRINAPIVTAKSSPMSTRAQLLTALFRERG